MHRIADDIGIEAFFFFNDTATTEIYTLSLHDALPILHLGEHRLSAGRARVPGRREDAARRGGPEKAHPVDALPHRGAVRSEEHTSELQSQSNLVCRLLLEKKNRMKRRGLRAAARAHVSLVY